MKKAASILLIALLFFNWYGYRIVVDIMLKKADRQLERTLDNNDYIDEQLTELKIPLNVPYQIEQPDFERCYGEIEIDGKLYTYVKRKIVSGHLILKCIPNETKQQIATAGHDYFKMANGLTEPAKQSQNKNLAKNFWNEYAGNDNNPEYLYVADDVKTIPFYHQSFYNSRYLSVITQPPDFSI